jgi:hypothetical protein
MITQKIKPLGDIDLMDPKYDGIWEKIIKYAGDRTMRPSQVTIAVEMFWAGIQSTKEDQQ